ncbi:short-chain dehydrogenase [Pseudoroseomonas deserti]|uniref:Short-chain dehydrogenase n=2 Tax=Teichococcus deserti TaxID=1817963 RepID=A0A1V2GUR8_9PROT|nr:short-chain dehydrogenase [Pseudoroseomonas deserti]
MHWFEPGGQRMIIVTGATQGIGRACVEQLSSSGRQVLATGRDAAAGAELAQLPGVRFVAGDVADPADVERVVAAAMEAGGGRLTGLVNNAGMGRRQNFLEASLADWDQVMAVNARSVFLFIRLALPGLIAGKGSVVTISSVAGRQGEEGLAVYCASKAALLGLTQALALEHGADVRFNAVCPGQIATQMMGRVLADPARRAALESRIPAARLGEAGDVAELVCWLLSDASRYVNGAVITVDGGETAGLRTPR